MSSVAVSDSLSDEGMPLLGREGTRRFLAAAVFAAALGLGIANRWVAPAPAKESLRPPELHLDPNTAPPEVLAALPHVGPKLVREWVKARAEGRFVSLEDAQSRVMGLGPATLGQVAPYLAFEIIRPRESRNAGGARGQPACPKAKDHSPKEVTRQSARRKPLRPRSSWPGALSRTTGKEQAERRLAVAHDLFVCSHHQSRNGDVFRGT